MFKPKFKRPRPPKDVLKDFVYRIGKLSVKPSDVIVIQTDFYLDKEQTQAIYDRVREHLERAGLKNKVMIFTHGLKLMVLEKEEK